MTLSIEGLKQPGLLTIFPDGKIQVDNSDPVRLNPWDQVVVKTIAEAGGKFVLKGSLDSALEQAGFKRSSTLGRIQKLRRLLTPGEGYSSAISMAGPKDKPYFCTDAAIAYGRPDQTDTLPSARIPLRQIPTTWRDRAKRMGIDPAAVNTSTTSADHTDTNPTAWLIVNYGLFQAAATRVKGYTSQPEDTEDAAQDGALAVFRFWKSFDPRLGTREAWAAAITRRRKIDQLRKETRQWKITERLTAQLSHETAIGTRVVDPEELVQAREDLEQAWRHLTSTEREFVPLLARGHPLSKTAEILGWPIGTLKTRIQRMRERMNGLEEV